MFDSEPNTHRTQNDSSSLKSRTPPTLSPTERRVAALLLQRLTEHRIAEHLQRSPNTVHVHVRNIYRKLGVHTRQELQEYPGIVGMIISKD